VPRARIYDLVPVSKLPCVPAASIAASEAGQMQHPEIGYMADPPTRDFLHWNGEVFQTFKKQNAVPKRTGYP
jgi:hypothetical protein